MIKALVTVAAELGTDPGRVATAWVAARGVVPILGVKTRAQLDGGLIGVALRLDPGQLTRLDAASALPPGYPHELTASAGGLAASTGDRWDQIDFPVRTVA